MTCAPENPERKTGHQIEGESWWLSFKSQFLVVILTLTIVTAMERPI